MTSRLPAPLAIVAVSRAGTLQARTIQRALPAARLVLPARFAGAGVCAYEGGVKETVAAEFGLVRGLVLVMAAGIAVRAVGPLLRDKRTDPAVVVVDDAGRFVISLVAGHLGGANTLAEHIAEAIGAVSVITTASEAAGLPALDLLAPERGWRIEEGSKLTRVSAALLNGEPLAVLQDCAPRDWLKPEDATHVRFIRDADEIAADDAGAIVVSCRRTVSLPDQLPRVVLRPPALVLGAGCSSGAPAEELIALAEAALAEADRAPACVACVATIDRRSAEPAIDALRRHFGVATRLFSAAELDTAPGEWQRSDVVKRAVGTAGVCEPAAILAAGGGRLLLAKRKSAHATVAVAHIAEDA